MHAEPLTLLAVVKSHLHMLVCAQLCNPQGVALFPFVRPSPRLPRPFDGARIYDVSLTLAERLRAVGCGFKGKLVQLLSLGMGSHFEPKKRNKLMQSLALRRVTAGLAAAERVKAAKDAEELCVLGQFGMQL